MSNEYGIDDQLATEDENESDYVHIGQFLYGMCCEFLDALDEITGTSNHDMLFGLVEDLDQQEMLSGVSGMCFLFFASDREFLFKYGNQFYRELPNLIDDLNEVAQQEKPQFEELRELVRSWGPLCETAIPPVIAIIQYLENDEIRLDKADDMTLKNSIEQVRGFPPLAPLGRQLNVNLRNAVLHGGKSGGCTPNPITNEVTIWFKEGQETKTEVHSMDSFKDIVIGTLAAVITLFLVPLYLITAHASIEITEAVTEAEHG